MKAETIICCLFLTLKSFRRNKRKENQGSRTIPARPHLHKLAEILEINHTAKNSTKTRFITVDEKVIKIKGELSYNLLNDF